MYHLQTKAFLPETRERVFAFFSDARNLGLITPPWMEFSITSRHDLTMREGLLIDYRIKLHGFPMSWRSEISVWEPQHRFVDEQRSGPYKTWVHEHSFAEVEGGTLVLDTVNYLPRGGSLVHRWLVRPKLEAIFAHRTQVLTKMFAAR